MNACHQDVKLLAIGWCSGLLFGVVLRISSGRSQMKEKSEREYADKYARPITSASARTISSLPGNAAVEGDDFIQPGAFPNATYCAHCHQEAYSQWRQALHSNSFRTPFYRASVNILLKPRALSSHAIATVATIPIAVLAGG